MTEEMKKGLEDAVEHVGDEVFLIKAGLAITAVEPELFEGFLDFCVPDKELRDRIRYIRAGFDIRLAKHTEPAEEVEAPA